MQSNPTDGEPVQNAKPPHDASVFVGSLPSNIDQADLTRLLMEHLSGHAEIKNIKVVRDSKGGVCAFVQCEDADAASSLIKNLYASAQKPFLGRILRYEPARAFRTLLISYRAPVQYVSQSACSPGMQNSYTEFQLDVPNAMRIWKHKNSKFYGVSYNDHAIHINDETNSEDALLLQPLPLDEDTLRRMVSFFGPLESFNTLDHRTQTYEENSSQPPESASKGYPPPHDVPRSEGMDKSCWEIKWKYRNDCVSALMTLRRVPHLTVTWAHQPNSSGYEYKHQQLSYPLHAQWRHNISLPQHGFRSPRQEVSSSQSQGYSYSQSFEEYSTAQRSPEEKRDNLDNAEKVSILSQSEAVSSSTDGHDQDILVPATPDFDSSIITPQTPSWQFPITPTSSVEAIRPDAGLKGALDSDQAVNGKHHNHEKIIDPTTLFVGGLEMFGPRAWDEEKVKRFFSRFGGLESVKFVRPMNSCAAFAFVRFDNAEAPARAVQEEHNRVYEGRAMRVQLRDCNPPRGTWRYGRGRGRPQNFIPFQRRSTPRTRNTDGHDDHKAHNQSFEGSDRLPTSVGPSLEEASSSMSSSMSASLPSLLSAYHDPDSSSSENYREWYDAPDSPSPTATPSSLGPSASVRGAAVPPPVYPTPVAGAPFVPPGAWVHPYIAPNAFPVPYYSGYPFFPPALQQHSCPLPSPPGSDGGGSAAALIHAWPNVGLYGSFVPYPVLAPTQPSEGGQAAQAPLVPSGFIQNEHGSLIAVYPPDALNQYLSNGAGGPPPTVPTANILPRLGFSSPANGPPVRANGAFTSNSFRSQMPIDSGERFRPPHRDARQLNQGGGRYTQAPFSRPHMQPPNSHGHHVAQSVNNRHWK